MENDAGENYAHQRQTVKGPSGTVRGRFGHPYEHQ